MAQGDHHGGLPVEVTEAALVAAVQASRSWRGVLRRLGLSSPRTGRALRAHCDRHGIPYDHFSSRSWDDADLRAAVAAAGSWPEVLSRLGYETGSGSARATVRKHASRLGLDTAQLAAPPAQEHWPFLRPPDPAHLRRAGPSLVAAACALQGHDVSVPLEPAAYDLVVDTGRLHRVQVKTTTRRAGGTWVCTTSRSASGRRAWYGPDEIDAFGIVDGDLAVYVVPVEVLAGLGAVHVRRYAAYRLPGTGPSGPAPAAAPFR